MGKRDFTNPNDKRTQYTTATIKRSVLELLSTKPFSKITVKEICAVSAINRGTFYLHYYDSLDVLDDLISEAFQDTSDILDHVLCPYKSTCTYPLCEKIQGSPTYHALFLDDTAAARIMERISESCKERFVTFLMQNSSLTFEQAEAIFYFQINGCMTVNRMMLKNKCTDWKEIQSVIDGYIRAGLQSYLQETQ